MDSRISKVFQEKIESDTTEFEKRYMALINGDDPQNEDEEQLLKEIEEAKKEGKIISVPSN